MKTMSKLILISSFIILLSGCKLVTVVKHEQVGEGNTAPGPSSHEAVGNLDPNHYADQVWNDMVIPYMLDHAADISDVLRAIVMDPFLAEEEYGLNGNYIVKGAGTVTAVNTDSGNGTIELDMSAADLDIELVIQIGPVFRGTSIRDSLDFISFDDFSNQIQFAQLSNAFNNKVYNELLVHINFQELLNQEIQFVGAFTLNDPSSIILTPVKIDS